MICGGCSSSDMLSGIGLAGCREYVLLRYLYGTCLGWSGDVYLKRNSATLI